MMSRPPSARTLTNTSARPSSRVIVADDHPLMRKALCGLVRAEFRGLFLHEVSSLEALIASLATTRARLVLLDLHLSDATAEQTIAALPDLVAQAPVLVLTAHLRSQLALECRARGALGVIGKHASRDTLTQFIGDALQGLRTPHLSQRQADVLALMAQGYGMQHIAQQLGVALSTVQDHTKALYRALAVNTRPACIQMALELGLVEAQRPGALPS